MKLVPGQRAAAALMLLVLCAVTALVLGSGWRYATAFHDLSGGFLPPGQPDRWRGSGVEIVAADGVATLALASGAGRRATALVLPLSTSEAFDALRSSVELRAENMVSGQRRWQRGWVQIRAYDGAGRHIWYWPKDVASLSGDTDWRRFEAVVPLAAEVKAGQLLIFNGALSGTLHVRNVRVAGLVERPVFAALEYALAVLWVLAGVWLCTVLLRSGGARPLRALVLALGLVTVAATVTPQPYFGRVTTVIETALAAWMAPQGAETPRPSASPSDATPHVPSPAAEAGPVRVAVAERAEPAFDLDLKRLGHFAMFALLTLATFVAYPQAGHWAMTLYLSLFAAASESLQFFLLTRSVRLVDLATDLTGILVAVGAIVIVRAIVTARRPKALGRRAARPAPPSANDARDARP